MANLNETPAANRVHIAFFGLRNAGKSTLVNALTGQSVSIVSPTPGTTTDPVSKAMEILPLGPCLVTDTAGLDDEGTLGEQRVARTNAVLQTTDLAVWVRSPGDEAPFASFAARCDSLKIPFLTYSRDESMESFRARLAALKLTDEPAPLLEGVLQKGASALLVCPIDGSAPKDRLILPQVQVLRACLDVGIIATVCQPPEVAAVCAARGAPFDLVITDSQAFAEVAAVLPPKQPLTSFSILFARQKGDLTAFSQGLSRLSTLRPGDRVLVAEGCTHHRQCADIGTVKIPRALKALVGGDLDFTFVSGHDFPEGDFALIVQCGGCMLTRREVMRRVSLAQARQIPIVNYGMLLARAAGVDVARCLRPLEKGG